MKLFVILFIVISFPPVSAESGSETVDDLYNNGLALVSGIYRKYKSGYAMLERAADLGHPEAIVEIAIANIFGDYLPFNFTHARLLLEGVCETDPGNTNAQFYLGFIHALGLGVESNQAKALMYYTFAALGDHSLGQIALAYRQLFEVSSVADCEQALALYSKVAGKVASEITLSSGPLIQRIKLNHDATGPDESSFLIGANKASVIIDQDTLAYYQLMAERGETQAQSGLGMLYYNGGRGINSNYMKALYYLEKAAAKGSHSSRAVIGKIYAQGDETVKADPKLALYYLRKAEEKNEPIAWAALGALYYHGIGVKKDYALAHQYLKVAAEANQIDATLWLGAMHFYGHGVPLNIRTAIQYFTVATHGGHILGPYYLAVIHEVGMGVVRSCDTSARLFKNVCERGRWSMKFMEAYYDYQHGRFDQSVMKYLFLSELGFDIAQTNAAVMLEHGKTTVFGVSSSSSPANKTTASPHAQSLAFDQHLRAAEQGQASSRVRVGDYYFYGMNVCDVDMTAAYTQYQMAAEQGSNAQAMFNLGYMHEHGLGYRKDFHLAKRFYDQAKSANADALLPATFAIVKLHMCHWSRKLLQCFRLIGPANKIATALQSLHVGSALSGFAIIAITLWFIPIGGAAA